MQRKFKTKRVVTGNQEYRSWELYSLGDVVVGEIVGFHKDQYDKDGLKLRVEEAMFKDGSGDALKGKVLVINSCGAIEKAKDELQLGELVQIEYTGKSQVKKGKFAGKDCHTVAIDIVEYDEDGADEEELDEDL